MISLNNLQFTKKVFPNLSSQESNIRCISICNPISNFAMVERAGVSNIKIKPESSWFVKIWSIQEELLVSVWVGSFISFLNNLKKFVKTIWFPLVLMLLDHQEDDLALKSNDYK